MRRFAVPLARLALFVGVGPALRTCVLEGGKLVIESLSHELMSNETVKRADPGL